MWAMVIFACVLIIFVEWFHYGSFETRNLYLHFVGLLFRCCAKSIIRMPWLDEILSHFAQYRNWLKKKKGFLLSSQEFMVYHDLSTFLINDYCVAFERNLCREPLAIAADSSFFLVSFFFKKKKKLWSPSSFSPSTSNWKYDERVRFSFHCFSIIKFGVHVCGLRPKTKRKTIAKQRPTFLWSNAQKRLRVPFHFCTHPHTSAYQPYGNGTLFLSWNTLSAKVTENEPNCQNHKRMTSLQTRDLSFANEPSHSHTVYMLPCQIERNSHPAILL